MLCTLLRRHKYSYPCPAATVLPKSRLPGRCSGKTDRQASLRSLHAASYHRYFLSSRPNLFHSHTCVSRWFFLFSRTEFFWAFALLKPQIIYLIARSQSTPFPAPSQGWGCPRQVSARYSLHCNFQEQRAALRRQSPVVSHVTEKTSLTLLLL